MSTLDDLFKDKLENHSIIPSPEAWNKVEAGLTNKKRPVIWLRWAAVFLLGGLLVGTFWLREKDAPVVLTQKKEIPTKTETPVKREESSKENKSENQKAQPAVAIERHPKQSPPQQVQQTIVQQEVAQIIPENNITSTVAEEIPAVVKTTQPASSAIVLTYTLDPIENKKVEATSEAVAASSMKKDNSLKRAMKFARDVKNSDAPFSELRVMKEELFALDFKKKATTKKQ